MRINKESRGLIALALVVVIVVVGQAWGGASTSATTEKLPPMQIHYLEIVTKDLDAVCAAYAAAMGVKFGRPDPGLGHARTAPLPDGEPVGVRPLRPFRILHSRAALDT